MAASGLLKQHAVLTQPKQAPARNAHALRMNGMPSAKPQSFQVCNKMRCISSTIRSIHVAIRHLSSHTLTRSSLSELSRSSILRPLTMTSLRNPQANKSFFGPTLPAQKHALSATRQRHTAVTRAAKDYTVSPLLIAIIALEPGNRRCTAS